MSDTVLKIDHVSKQYRLGTIGGGTLQADIQSWWAKIRGKEDPNLKIDSKTYGRNAQFWALDDVSLEVKQGDTLGIIGHNGAGKSTLLKLLSRVTAPTKGTIYVKGRISSMLEVGTGFHGELTGRENIYMNGAILGMSRAEINSKIDDIIEFSECAQFIDTPVKRYSSGMYVKLAFAVSAHLDSEILIMDEVLAVGDMNFQQKCLTKMRNVAEKDGRTVLYVSHNMNTIRQLCNRCIVMNKGTKIYDGEVEPAIEKYIGEKNISINPIVDLSKYKRPDGIKGDVQLLSSEVDDIDDLYIERGKLLQFRLILLSKCNIRRAGLRFVIKNAADVTIGTSISNSIQNISSGRNSYKLSFPTNSLTPGIYSADIILYEMDEKGYQTRLDIVANAVTFETVEQRSEIHTPEWNYHSWGYVNFNEIAIEKE